MAKLRNLKIELEKLTTTEKILIFENSFDDAKKTTGIRLRKIFNTKKVSFHVVELKSRSAAAAVGELHDIKTNICPLLRFIHYETRIRYGEKVLIIKTKWKRLPFTETFFVEVPVKEVMIETRANPDDPWINQMNFPIANLNHAIFIKMELKIDDKMIMFLSEVSPEIPKTIKVPKKEPLIHIYLGNKKCSVEIFKDNKWQVLDGMSGRKWFYLSFGFTNNWIPILSGQLKKDDRHCCVYDLMKILGKKLSQIQVDPSWPFKVLEEVDKSEGVLVRLQRGDQTHTLSVNYLIASVIKILHEHAENKLGINTDAVRITVCDENDEDIIEALKKISKETGLEIVC
uniref:Uncharacterized protein n=1 Tax=Panagrolaimus sp. JU765 TaxID=591449 RepID=A0AC34QG40_9BILA